MKNMSSFLSIIFYLIFLNTSGQSTIYVDYSATGSNNGTSWANAYTSFQSAIETSSSGDEIWVAAGTYKPSKESDGTTDTPREYCFVMQAGVEMYGGFEGTETATSQRTNYGNGESNETILSGDIGTVDDTSDNCYQVILNYNNSLTSSSVIDGFTVTRGNANGSGSNDNGGGMYNYNVSPSINNCNFISNQSDFGGAIYNFVSTSTITNCTFISNFSSWHGGAMSNYNCNLLINNCSFSSNSSSSHGGAIRNQGQGSTIKNSSFQSNTAYHEGGAISNFNSIPTIINCTFSSNSGSYGGAVRLSDNSSSVVNCTFSSNNATYRGGAIYITHGINASVTNCILWGNSAGWSGDEIIYSYYTSVTYSNIQGGHSGIGNINQDPQFVGSIINPDHPYLIFGTSPCTDAANNNVNSESYDIRGTGYDRKLNKTDGTIGTIDMGAYEYKYGTDLYNNTVTWDGDTDGDWSEASNWNPNFVPVTVNDVIIADVTNQPVLTTSDQVTCNDLTVNTGATLTIESGASATASLIVNGTATGNIIMQRQIASWTDNLHGWHHISSPVTAQDIQPNFVANPPTTNEDFYSWDEVNNYWINAKDNSGNWNTSFEDDFVVGTGYLVSFGSSTAVSHEFSGVPNTGDVVKTGLAYTESSGASGWHLLGNPYPSALLWNNTNWNLSNIDATAKVWDEGNSSYVDISSGDVIPSNQGFMTHVTASGTGSLTIDASDRTHDATNWYKSAGAGANTFVLIAHDPVGNTSQKSIIKINNNASPAFDSHYDSKFISGYAPQFYSIANGIELSTNTLPELRSDMVVPFGFVKNGSENFYLEAVGLEEFETEGNVFLKDKLLNKTHNLSEDPVYHFSSSSSDEINRFEILFNPLGIDVSEQQQLSLHVYSSKNKINIINVKGIQGKVYVFDIFGRCTAKFELTGAKVHQHSTHGSTGIYIVKIISKDGKESSQKIFMTK